MHYKTKKLITVLSEILTAILLCLTSSKMWRKVRETDVLCWDKNWLGNKHLLLAVIYGKHEDMQTSTTSQDIHLKSSAACCVINITYCCYHVQRPLPLSFMF